MKKKLVDREESVEDNSARVLDIEKGKLPLMEMKLHWKTDPLK